MSRGPVSAARGVASIVALSLTAACGGKTSGGGNSATNSGVGVGGSSASSGGPGVSSGSSGATGNGATSNRAAFSGSSGSAANSTSNGTSSGLGATGSASAAGPTLFDCPMNCSARGVCCLTLVGAEVQGTCASMTAGCGSAAATIACKANADCNGQTCCIIPAAGDGPASSHCAATCPPQQIACGVDADCPTDGGPVNCAALTGTPEAVFGVCRPGNGGGGSPDDASGTGRPVADDASGGDDGSTAADEGSGDDGDGSTFEGGRGNEGGDGSMAADGSVGG
jgi:hypothetical protein